jgi:hypothetical protein
MLAAGVRAERNPVAVAKQLSTLVGHASITQTLDRFGHLFPGSEGEAAAALDAYLEGAVDGGGGVACTPGAGRGDARRRCDLAPRLQGDQHCKCWLIAECQ